jgi:hypothetical protein
MPQWCPNPALPSPPTLYLDDISQWTPFKLTQETDDRANSQATTIDTMALFQF